VHRSKVHLVRYNSVADSTGLSSFVLTLLPLKSAKSRKIPRKFEHIARGHWTHNVRFPIGRQWGHSQSLQNPYSNPRRQNNASASNGPLETHLSHVMVRPAWRVLSEPTRNVQNCWQTDSVARIWIKHRTSSQRLLLVLTPAEKMKALNSKTLYTQ